MKYPAEHKANVKQRLREQAAKQIREQGIDNVSIKSVMAAEQMTVGGFYTHFANRDALICEAIDESFKQIQRRYLSSLTHTDAREWTQHFVNLYLSEAHRDGLDQACPIAGLLSQIPSQSDSVKEEYKLQTEALLAAYANKIEGHSNTTKTKDQARAKTWSLLAVLAGGLQLSRAMNDKEHIQEVLASCRAAAMELID